MGVCVCVCVCLYSDCYRKQRHMARDYEMHFKETRVKWTRRVGERAIDKDRDSEGGREVREESVKNIKTSFK